ncbi:MAG: VPLPA-CTERM sorting domain-containing protein, partial [Planctomycetota bacterium]
MTIFAAAPIRRACIRLGAACAAALLVAQPAWALTVTTDYTIGQASIGTGSIGQTVPSDDDLGDFSGVVTVGGALAELSVQASAGSGVGDADASVEALIFITNSAAATSATLHFLFEYDLLVQASGELPASSAEAEGLVVQRFQGLNVFRFDTPDLLAEFNDDNPAGDVFTVDDGAAFSLSIGSGETIELLVSLAANARVTEEILAPDADALAFASGRLTVTSIDGGEVAPVPLPAAAAMLLAGLGALGAAARRRARPGDPLR